MGKSGDFACGLWCTGFESHARRPFGGGPERLVLRSEAAQRADDRVQEAALFTTTRGTCLGKLRHREAARSAPRRTKKREETI